MDYHKDKATRLLLMIMKNPKTHLDKSAKRIQRLKVPMCFKGDDGSMNEKLFQLYQIQEPLNKGSNKHARIDNFIQIDQLHKQNFRGLEHWTTRRACLQSILSLIHELDVMSIPLHHRLNDLKLPPAPESKDKIPRGKKISSKLGMLKNIRN